MISWPRLARRRRPFAVAAAAVLLAAAGTAAAAPASAAPAGYGSCADVQVIAVRGTSEPVPLSGSLLPLAYGVASLAPATVLSYGLPYPATSEWVSSVNTGISDLAQRMALSAFYCPRQRFVLIGYSQGAWVIGDALAGGGGGVAPAISPALGSKVAAVILYGDPRYRSGEPFTAGTAATAKSGVNGAIPRDRGALASYASRIRSYCETDDTVCQNGSRGDGHFRYWTTYSADAVFFVLGRLGS